jgi:hypothetical protein
MLRGKLTATSVYIKETGILNKQPNDASQGFRKIKRKSNTKSVEGSK